MGHGTAAGWIVLAVAVASCDAPVGPAPPDVTLGESLCAECGMIIADGRFGAAEICAADGARETAVYDDMGCQLFAARTSPGRVALHRWVRDFETGAWLDARNAHFVYGSSIPTPMASGIVAFASGSSAGRAVAASGGRILNFEELARAHRAALDELYGTR